MSKTRGVTTHREQQAEAGALADEGWLYHPEYPNHWERCSLYSMAEWVNDLAFRQTHFSPTGKPIIKIAEIKAGISEQTKFTQQTLDESVCVRPGDLLFSCLDSQKPPSTCSGGEAHKAGWISACSE